MTNMDVAGRALLEGDASRYFKLDWIKDGRVAGEAFDLRQGEHPETYVSHFLVEGDGALAKYRSAYEIIHKRMRGGTSGKLRPLNGGISLLSIEQVLEEVNFDSPLVQYRGEGLPHCGLYYLTENARDRNEAKATLCYMAGQNMMSAPALVGEQLLVRMLVAEGEGA